MKFKVGDKVRYTYTGKGRYNFSEYEGGNEGVVVAISERLDYPYTVRFYMDEQGGYHPLICAEYELEEA